MPRAIVFLVAPRALVLLDDVAVVFVEAKAGRQAGLLVAAHAAADRNTRSARLRRRADDALQQVEIRGGPLVDRVGVRIRAWRQLDLGPRDAEKTQRVAVGERARFVGVDDVVGHGGDGGAASRVGRSARNGRSVAIS